MLTRYRKWRNRMTCEVVMLGGFRFRVTKQRGQIIGIEMWQPTEHATTQYIYKVWKAEA